MLIYQPFCSITVSHLSGNFMIPCSRNFLSFKKKNSYPFKKKYCYSCQKKKKKNNLIFSSYSEIQQTNSDTTIVQRLHHTRQVIFYELARFFPFQNTAKTFLIFHFEIDAKQRIVNNGNNHVSDYTVNLKRARKLVYLCSSVRKNTF